MPRVSVIVPVLDEAPGVAAALGRLQAARRASQAEVIVVDGGSRDATRSLAAPLADAVLDAPRGRARQMNAGARAATGVILLFLHADTQLPAGWLEAIVRAVEAGARWGRFDVAIDAPGPLLRVVAAMMNLRSRASGIATGDQAIFCTRAAFDAAGGFPDIALMEDIALSRALGRQARPACLRLRVRTSARRWQRRGTLRTILLMWRLRASYALGADPERLARRYDAGS